MKASERRTALMKLLCRRRCETIFNLAAEFGVSERTIRRDIETLSLTEPIYTRTGRYGGVYVTDTYDMDRLTFQESETSILCKLLNFAEKNEACGLTDGDIHLLKKMIAHYTKPRIDNGLNRRPL